MPEIGWPRRPLHREGDEPTALPAGDVENLIRDHTLQSVENQIFVSFRALFAVNPVRALRLIQKTADQTLEMLGELGTDLGHPGEPGNALTDVGLGAVPDMMGLGPVFESFKPMLEAQRIQSLSAAIRNLEKGSPARRSLEAELLKLVPPVAEEIKPDPPYSEGALDATIEQAEERKTLVDPFDMDLS